MRLDIIRVAFGLVISAALFEGSLFGETSNPGLTPGATIFRASGAR